MILMKNWIVLATLALFLIVGAALFIPEYMLPTEQEQLFSAMKLDNELQNEMKIIAITRRGVNWGEEKFPYSMKVEASLDMPLEEVRQKFHDSIKKTGAVFEGYAVRYGRFAEFMTCSDRSEIPASESQQQGGRLLGQGGNFYAELNNVKQCFCWSVPDKQWRELSKEGTCAYLYPLHGDRAVYLFSGDARRYDARTVILNFIPETDGSTTVVITASKNFFGFGRILHRDF
jgi:hypothetical protein